MAVRIVTDSTSDIPLEQARALDIAIVPLTVFFGDQAYLDGIELDNAGFYARLQTSQVLPRTSQPSPAAFQEAYARLIEEEADAILSVHLSSKLSGTYQSACTARDSLPDELKKVPIEVIDSGTVSMGIGMPVMLAAEEAKRGLPREEIEKNLRDRLARVRVLGVLDTLEYLKRGGRIGAARALMGNMLSIKPIISIKDGIVVPLEQPRTRSKAYARIAQLVQEMKPERLSVIGSSEEVCRQLAEALSTSYQGEMPEYLLGAVLGTYTGPGTAGVVMLLRREG